MTSPLPAPPSDYGQWNWEQAFVNVLGAAQPMNRNRFLGGNAPWIQHLNTHLIEQVANKTKPWNDPLPTGQPGQNHFTIYHKSSVDQEDGSTLEQFVIIEGIASWYEKASFTDNGSSYSPHDMYLNEFFAKSRDGLTNAPNVLSRQSVQHVLDSMTNFAHWLANVDTRLQGMTGEVDATSSGFKGTTSEFFLYKVRNFQRDVQTLHTDVAGDSGTNGWLNQLSAVITAIDTFLRKVGDAWQTFQQQPDPSRMISNVMAQIEREADATDRQLHWGDNVPDYTGAAGGSGAVPVWNFNLDILHDPPQNPVQYDLVQPSQFVTLNTNMQNAWSAFAHDLDLTMQQELKTLATALTTAVTTMKLDPPHNLPGPKMPGPDGTGNHGPGGGGSDTNLPHIDTNLHGGGGGGGGADIGGGGGPNGGGSHLNLANPPGIGGTGGGGGGGFDTSLGGAHGGGAGGGFDTSLGSGGLPGFGLPGFSGLSGGGLSSGGGSTNRKDITTGGVVGGKNNTPDSRFPTPVHSTDLHSPLSSPRGGVSDDRGSYSGGLHIGPLGSEPGLGSPGFAGRSAYTALAGGASGLGGVGPGGATGLGGGAGLAELSADGAVPGTGAPATDGSLAGGLGGFPFMPPMGGMGAGAGQQEKERERTTWLAEDEDVWGTDPDVAPAVVGRDEIPDVEPGDRSARRPAPSRRTTTPPQTPARTGGSQQRPRWS